MFNSEKNPDYNGESLEKIEIDFSKSKNSVSDTIYYYMLLKTKVVILNIQSVYPKMKLSKFLSKVKSWENQGAKVTTLKGELNSFKKVIRYMFVKCKVYRLVK